MPPLISIIIPAYNSADTIAEALDSVAAQTFSDYEVIVVDDSSTDSTIAVAQAWSLHSEEKGRRVTGLQGGNVVETKSKGRKGNFVPFIISLPQNSGPAAARNRGIAEARGTWISFLDADDAWLPDKLEIQLKSTVEHPDVELFCGGTVLMSDEREYNRRQTQTCQPLPTKSGGRLVDADREAMCADGDAPLSGECFMTQSHLSKTLSIGVHQRSSAAFSELSQPRRMQGCLIKLEEFAVRNQVSTSTVLVRKNAIVEAGGFDEGFRGPEDYDLWIRIAARHPVFRTPIPLSRYRERSGSLSMDDRKFLPEVMRVLDKAFGEGGALRAHRHLRAKAISAQLWSASRMALCRGARWTATQYLVRAWLQRHGARRYPKK